MTFDDYYFENQMIERFCPQEINSEFCIVIKFCATTQFDASKVLATGFKAPYTLGEGLARTLEFEFVHPRTDDITFKSE